MVVSGGAEAVRVTLSILFVFPFSKKGAYVQRGQWHGRSLSLHPPMYTLSLHHTEQRIPRKDGGPSEHLLQLRDKRPQEKGAGERVTEGAPPPVWPCIGRDISELLEPRKKAASWRVQTPPQQ